MADLYSLYNSRDYWNGKIDYNKKIIDECDAFEKALKKASTDLNACIKELNFVKNNLTGCLQIDGKNYKVETVNNLIKKLQERQNTINNTLIPSVVSQRNSAKANKNTASNNYYYYINQIAIVSRGN